MKFSIGVIVYNPDASVVSRLKKYRELTKNIYIFDNTEVINPYCQEIENEFENYISFKKNLGMSMALNYLFDCSFKKDDDYMLTMDQDSDFSNEDILNMLDVINQNTNSKIVMFCPNYRKIYESKYKDEPNFGKYSIDNDTVKEVNFSMTSGSFCNVKELKKYFPLENLFIGFVDNDLCFEIISDEKKILMVGNIKFSQRVGSPVSGSAFNKFFRVVYQNEERYYYMTRNNLILQKKYKKNIKIKLLLVVSLLRIHINILIGEKQKLLKIKSCLKGYTDYKKEILGPIQVESE